MNLPECKQIIQSLKKENNPENDKIIKFYERKKLELIKMISENVKNYL